MSTTRDSDKMSILSQLLAIEKDISGLPECRNTSKKMYYNMVRRIKLLNPLFEELKDNEDEVEDSVIRAFESLRDALYSAEDLLKSVNDGSKLYQVFICSALRLGSKKKESQKRKRQFWVLRFYAVLIYNIYIYKEYSELRSPDGLIGFYVIRSVRSSTKWR